MFTERKLKAFARALGLEWYHNIEEVTGRIDQDRLPGEDYLKVTRGEFDRLRNDVDLLIDYLGLKVIDGRRLDPSGEKAKSRQKMLDEINALFLSLGKPIKAKGKK